MAGRQDRASSGKQASKQPHQPDVPEAVDVGVVCVEERVVGRRPGRAHVHAGVVLPGPRVHGAVHHGLQLFEVVVQPGDLGSRLARVDGRGEEEDGVFLRLVHQDSVQEVVVEHSKLVVCTKAGGQAGRVSAAGGGLVKLLGLWPHKEDIHQGRDRDGMLGTGVVGPCEGAGLGEVDDLAARVSPEHVVQGGVLDRIQIRRRDGVGERAG